jgi:D-alanyl-D-alanine endopeptidase (penicillin-binding protein 7)
VLSFRRFEAVWVCTMAITLTFFVATPESLAARRGGETAPSRARLVKPTHQPTSIDRHRIRPQMLADSSSRWVAGRAVGSVAHTTASPGSRAFAATSRVTSIGQAIGLRLVEDPLDLRSSVALVVDQQSGDALFEKNATAVLPIASITKLMTAMVVLDAQQPLSELIAITADDIDTEKFSRSRLRPGVRLTRAELLNLALMASENRAAHALGRTFPGGLAAYAEAANVKARSIGMHDSRFVEPTGLSSRNVSTAQDLVRMVRAAYEYPLIRQYSTTAELTVGAGLQHTVFRNTNRLVESPTWDIGLQKTGFINEAGNCLVMQARVEGRSMIMVLLDADGRQSRLADAQRLRQWMEHGASMKAVLHERSVWRSLGYDGRS